MSALASPSPIMHYYTFQLSTAVAPDRAHRLNWDVVQCYRDNHSQCQGDHEGKLNWWAIHLVKREGIIAQR